MCPCFAADERMELKLHTDWQTTATSLLRVPVAKEADFLPMEHLEMEH